MSILPTDIKDHNIISNQAPISNSFFLASFIELHASCIITAEWRSKSSRNCRQCIAIYTT